MRLLAIIGLTAMQAIPAQAETTRVTMQGVTYAPERVEAELGDTLRFVNDSGVAHNVFVPTEGHAFDLGNQEPGETREFVLGRPGSFEVQCVLHPNMTMQVEVE